MGKSALNTFHCFTDNHRTKQQRLHLQLGWASALAGTALGQKAEMHKLDHVKQHKFRQALTATRGSAPVL